jgi:hypothetical protein
MKGFMGLAAILVMIAGLFLAPQVYAEDMPGNKTDCEAIGYAWDKDTGCRLGCGKQATFFDWGCGGGDGITGIISAIFWIVSGLVAAGCLGAIVYGGIRYSAAGDDNYFRGVYFG